MGAAVATSVLLTGLLVAQFVSLVAADMSMPMPPMSQSAPTDQPACVANSSAASCASYTYPVANAYADLDNLCTAMSFMPGCSMYNACNLTRNDALLSAAVCDPFQLLTTICKLDTGMSMMSGCTNFNSLCSGTSVVRQCSSTTGLTFLPTTAQVNSDVKSICTEMTMDGCELCTPDWEKGKQFSTCNLFDVYSYLCYTMPDMHQCATGSNWRSICGTSSTAKLYFCKGQMMSPASLLSAKGTGSGMTTSSNGSYVSSKFKPGPVMKMYFFTDTRFYLLFKRWTPDTPAQYAGAWFATFAMGVVYELLHMFRSWFEHYWRSKQNSADVEKGNGATEGSHGRLKRAVLVWLCQDFARAVIVFVSAGLGYLLMLATMSFNVGILFAAVAGLAFGTLLFFRFHKGNVDSSDGRACCTG